MRNIMGQGILQVIMRSAAARALLFALPIFLLLGSRGLNEPDEGRYGEIAREMLVSGDWWVPRIKDVPHDAKPPLTYQLTALSFRVFGFNEFAARFVPALAALMTLLALFAVARRLANERVALFASFGLASSLHFFAMQRILTTDMLLTALVVGSFACLLRGQDREVLRADAPNWHGALAKLGFWFLLGLAVLTKGPIPLMLMAGLCLGLGRARRENPLRESGALFGLPIFLALATGWYAWRISEDPALFDHWFGREVQARVQDGLGRSKPFWYFAPVLLIGALPWTPMALGAFFGRRQANDIGDTEAQGNWRAGQALTLHAVLWPLLVFSLAASKLWTYVLPLLPWIFLRFGFWLDCVAFKGPWQALRGGWCFPIAATAKLLRTRDATTAFLMLVGLTWVLGQGLLLFAESQEDRLGHNTSYRSFYESLPERAWRGAVLRSPSRPETEAPVFAAKGDLIASYRFRSPSAAIYLLRDRAEYLPNFGGGSLWKRVDYEEEDEGPRLGDLAEAILRRGQGWVLTKDRHRAEFEAGLRDLNRDQDHDLDRDSDHDADARSQFEVIERAATGEGKRRVVLLEIRCPARR